MCNIEKDLKHLNLNKDIFYKVEDMFRTITLKTKKTYRSNLRKSILYACLNLIYLKEGIFQDLNIDNKSLSTGLKIVKLNIPECRMICETVEYYLNLFARKLNLHPNDLTHLLPADNKGNKKQIALDITYRWLNSKVKISKNELCKTLNLNKG